MVYSEFITANERSAYNPLSCYKFTVNHGFTGLIAFIKPLLHICSKVSQNKTEQIKCNDIDTNSTLPPNSSSSETVVVPTKWLPSNTQM